MDGAADYVFLREIGRGLHGRVFLARAPARLEVDEPQVAVKVLLAPASDGGFDALVGELEAFAEVGSPRLVPVHDVAMDGGMHVLRHAPPAAGVPGGTDPGGVAA